MTAVRATAFVATLAAITLACPVALADQASDAKDLFDRGRELRAAGDCAGALPLFHKAFEIFPAALGSLRNAAECEEATGKWASARRSWLDLERALLLQRDTKYAGWEHDAAEAADRLEPRVSHLTVDVSSGGHHTDWIEVSVNGEPLSPTLVGTRLDRDPGHYEIKARLGEGEPARQAIDLVTGESRTVHLTVAPAGQPLPPQTPPSEPSAWTPAGWVTLSVGLATLAGMFIAIGIRAEALDSIDQTCNLAASPECPVTEEPTANRGATASTAATVLAVVGGVATGAGILMLVLGAASTHREHVAITVSPFGAGISGRF